MRDDDATAVALGLGILALSGFRTVPWGAPEHWLWPVPPRRIGDVMYRASISDPWGTQRPDGRTHRGVDIMYRRRSKTDLVAEYPPRSSSGSPMHFAPWGTPIVAARDGIVWSCARTPRGWTIVLSHGRPFATYYTHLEVPVFPEHARGVNTATGKPTPVRRGDGLGVMGWDPMDPAKLRHLHFAVWVGGGESAAANPETAMRTWPISKGA